MNELSIFDPIFDDVCGLPFPTFQRTHQIASPKVDVTENADSYVLDMDLPGKTENDVDIDLKDNVLSISSRQTQENEESNKGEKKAKEEEPKVQYLIRERYQTSFTRRFTLPNDVDAEGISANFKNGVLEVRMPRKQLAQPKKIMIKAC